MADVDVFPNVYTHKLTMSAADTLTFDDFDVGMNLFDKAALRIQKIQYSVSPATIELATASGDDIEAAITNSDSLTSIKPDILQVIDSFALERVDLGTAGTGTIREVIAENDFSTLSGGGLLVAPKPLYFAMATSGLASAGICTFRVYFTIIRLTDAQYLELLQTRNPFS